MNQPSAHFTRNPIAPRPRSPRMSRDPLALYPFLLSLQLHAGTITLERAASNVAEMQHELGRRVPMSDGPPMLA